ncbi:hypothetical protein LX36DRAFT_391739 [Colletotrichum falcatum]|nr:hypothetical protein LX36DRAFT_391739 [Colletotrichum falcatum]
MGLGSSHVWKAKSSAAMLRLTCRLCCVYWSQKECMKYDGGRAKTPFTTSQSSVSMALYGGWPEPHAYIPALIATPYSVQGVSCPPSPWITASQEPGRGDTHRRRQRASSGVHCLTPFRHLMRSSKKVASVEELSRLASRWALQNGAPPPARGGSRGNEGRGHVGCEGP